MKSQTVSHNIIYNEIKVVSRIAFPLITFSYASRILHAENIGKVNFSSSFVNYFNLIASLGLSTYAIRECSRLNNEQEKFDETASQLFSINICTMLFSYLLLGFALLVSSSIRGYGLLILIYSINIFFSIIGTDWINAAKEDFKYISIRTLLFQILSLFLILTMVRGEEDYLKFACISVLGASGSNVINIFYRRRYCKIHFTFHMDLKKHMKPILLLFSLVLAQSVLNNLDITMIGFIINDQAVGYYSTAVKIYTIIEQLVSSISLVLLPQLTYQIYKKNYNKVNALLHKSLNFIVTLGMPCATGLFMLSKEILTLACGPEYSEAAQSLSILSLAMVVNLIGGSFWGNLILLPYGREAQFMVACLVSALINGIANYILIPVMGINGAALTTLFSMFIILLICRFRKSTDIKIGYKLTDFFPVFIGCIMIVAVCTVWKNLIANYIIRIIICIFQSCLIYVLILYLGKNEIIKFMLSKTKQKIQEIRTSSGERRN